jgi:hypothetical protein
MDFSLTKCVCEIFSVEHIAIFLQSTCYGQNVIESFVKKYTLLVPYKTTICRRVEHFQITGLVQDIN